jgi:hypothetical protein
MEQAPPFSTIVHVEPDLTGQPWYSPDRAVLCDFLFERDRMLLQVERRKAELELRLEQLEARS